MFFPKMFQIPQMFLLKIFQIPQMFLLKIFQIPQMFGQNRGKIYRFINIITFEQRLHNLWNIPS